MLERELAWLKEHLSQLDSPVVFCHNDLLCKNIIYDSTKGKAVLALAARQGSVPEAGTWTSKRRPFGLGLKLTCRREMEKEALRFVEVFNIRASQLLLRQCFGLPSPSLPLQAFPKGNLWPR